MSLIEDIRRPWPPGCNPPSYNDHTGVNRDPTKPSVDSNTESSYYLENMVSLTIFLSNSIGEIRAKNSRILRRLIPLSAKLAGVSRCFEIDVTAIAKPNVQKLLSELLADLLLIVTVSFIFCYHHENSMILILVTN